MEITAAMVKQLREMTGAGVMNCKKALVETDGDFDKAIEVLRETGYYEKVIPSYLKENEYEDLAEELIDDPSSL